METKRITSRENRWLKAVRLAARPSRHSSDELVLAEGIRTVEEAANSAYAIEAAIYSEGFGGASREMDLLALLSRKAAQVCQTSQALFNTASSVNSPQGILALVRVPPTVLDSVGLARVPFLVCAWGIQDPGNLGTLIRTARAAGATLLCTTVGTVSARNPKSVRSSAGAYFRMPVVENLKPPDLLSFCEERHIKAWTTTPHGGIEYFRADFHTACALILGNEAQGISGDILDVLPRLQIPMSAGSESLNVAAAGAVLMMEAFRQRSLHGILSPGA